jgi:dihydrofolate synthase/folylpolyglutamate synthase
MDDLLTHYSAAIEALFARTTSGTKFGLERTEEILSKLGSPHRKLTAVHIAGTNGKGSVVATTEALLRAKGLKVGRYTSPHLIDFRERITVNGAAIPEEDVLEFLQQWMPTAEDLGATFFELTTALAFDWLARQEVDIAVIETGLGGRLDSTNVLTPRVATVTSIGLDHTELLGNTLEAIAREKAGIFKRDVPAVVGEADPAISALLAHCAKEAGSDPIVMVDDVYRTDDIEISPEGTTFTLKSGSNQQRVTTPLTGVFQPRNTAIALATIDRLAGRYSTTRRTKSPALRDVSPPLSTISKALANVFLPGRFQRSGKFIFDVAHNPNAARALAETMRAVSPPAPRTALLAVLSDKDWRGVIRELAPVVDRFVLTIAPTAPAERKWNAAEALEFARSSGFNASLELDFDRALAQAEDGSATVLVTGSFHTVGDAMSRLQVSPFAA